MSSQTNLMQKTGQSPTNSEVFQISVGQLAKNLCPTLKPAPDGADKVGRHDEPFFDNFQKKQTDEAQESLHNIILKTMEDNRANKQPPKSKWAKYHLEHLQYMCRSFRLMSPKMSVYLRHYAHLQEIKQVFIPLQYKLFIEIAKSHALLNYREREPHKNGILTNDNDFYFALRILRFRLPKKRLKLLYRGRNSILTHIQKYYPDRVFTSLMLLTDTDYSKSYIKEVLKQLVREGIISAKEKRAGRYIKYILEKKTACRLPIDNKTKERSFDLEVI